MEDWMGQMVDDEVCLNLLNTLACVQFLYQMSISFVCVIVQWSLCGTSVCVRRSNATPRKHWCWGTVCQSICTCSRSRIVFERNVYPHPSIHLDLWLQYNRPVVLEWMCTVLCILFVAMLYKFVSKCHFLIEFYGCLLTSARGLHMTITLPG